MLNALASSTNQTKIQLSNTGTSPWGEVVLMKQWQIETQLKTLLYEQKRQSYIKPETISDAEALGVLCAKACEWEATKIFDVCRHMFEDANLHSFNEDFNKLIEGKMAEVKQ